MGDSDISTPSSSGNAGDGLYVVADLDLRTFVAAWLAEMSDDTGPVRRLLDEARTDPDLSGRYGWGGRYVFSKIGPRATDPGASHEELLLFAVVCAYTIDHYPGADPTVWEGEDVHVRRAFAHYQQLGPIETARRLRADVLERARRERPAELEELLKRSQGYSPARSAAHDRELAQIDSRSFRAADLLDPDADPDLELRALLSPDG